MRTLIQVCAFNGKADYEAMALLLAKSFAKTNQWMGGKDTVYLETVVQSELDLNDLKVPDGRKMMAKVYLGTLQDFSQWDRVIMLDADMLLISSLQPILNDFCGFTGFPFAISAFAETRGATPAQWCYFHHPSKPFEKGISAINSGFVMARGSEWAGICQMWWDRIVKDESWNTPSRDQTALNDLIMEGKIACRVLPDYYMASFKEGDSKITPETILLHFNTPERLAVMRRVTELIGLYEKTPRECDVP